MKKTILFDLDGTLIDSTTAILDSFKVAMSQTRVKFDAEKIKSLIGYPLDIMFRDLGFVENEVDSLVNAYRTHYGQIYLAQTTLLPSVNEALNLASEFADLAVVTTKTSKFSVILLENLGVAHFFKVIIGKEDVIQAKPAAEPILTALARLKKGKENAFMVGDTSLDIKAALNAKISPLALSCGYESAENLAIHGVKVVPNALEAVKFIKEI